MTTTNNAVIHLFELENYNSQRRKPILDALTAFLNSSSYIDIISVAIKNKKDDDVISVCSIPKILNIIVSCLSLLDLSKKLSNDDVKFFVFGILYNFIISEDANFFEECLSLGAFETMYVHLFEIILLSPQLVEVGKSLLCC